MSLNFTVESTVTPITFGKIKSAAPPLPKESQTKLINYITSRLDTTLTSRQDRIKRYANNDRMLSTQTVLSPQDSKRRKREDKTGKAQAIAANLPIADEHIEDTTSFLAEIFVPASGAFMSTQGGTEKVAQVQKLAEKLESDGKASNYYDEVSATMRTLLKYNAGGMYVRWAEGDPNAIGATREAGNRFKKIDMYNFMYDSTIENLNELRSKGEWCAEVSLQNRLWLLRGAQSGFLMNVQQAIDIRASKNDSAKSKYYKRSPSEARLTSDGEDVLSDTGGSTDMAWGTFGLSMPFENTFEITSHEIVDVDIWINPKNFGLSSDDRLALYRVMLCDGETVIHLSEQVDAVELPLSAGYYKSDEMLDATRSVGEHMRTFQRNVSFMVNTAIAVERGNTYQQRAYDPSMIDIDDTQSGETSGWLKTKIPGRDVRTGVTNLNIVQDTSRHFQAISGFMSIAREMFPSQGLPSQVAGIDRAVTSQVAAVMQGAVRKLHNKVRRLDAILMAPLRIAAYRNYINHAADTADYSKLTETDVSRLLASGLGQLNREVAAAAFERLLFTLIQNPESAAQFDIPMLFKAWSQMLNTGTDLSNMVSQQGAAGQQGATPVPPNPDAAAAGAVDPTMQQGTM